MPSLPTSKKGVCWPKLFALFFTVRPKLVPAPSLHAAYFTDMRSCHGDTPCVSLFGRLFSCQGALRNFPGLPEANPQQVKTEKYSLSPSYGHLSAKIEDVLRRIYRKFIFRSEKASLPISKKTLFGQNFLRYLKISLPFTRSRSCPVIPRGVFHRRALVSWRHSLRIPLRSAIQLSRCSEGSLYYPLEKIPRLDKNRA